MTVINAKHAMPSGGTLEISARNVQTRDDAFLSNIFAQKHSVRNGQDLRFIKFSVKDTGIGISKDHLNHIFDPFFSTKQDGSGLGLASTYSIIKKHAGFIQVDSMPQVGTTFTIYIPASDRTDLASAKQEYKTTVGNAKILIMDDESYLCDIITQMLGHLGHHVEVAQDGSVACDKFRSARDAGSPFDLVILDLTVPGGMGGVATITELKKLDPKVVAIASSGYSDDPVMAQPDRYGFVAKINKPYIHDELAKVIDTALAQNQLH